ncbi:MAG: hypothetical protein U0837_16085 [Dehalococcoidia bacterium]
MDQVDWALLPDDKQPWKIILVPAAALWNKSAAAACHPEQAQTFLGCFCFQSVCSSAEIRLCWAKN